MKELKEIKLHQNLLYDESNERVQTECDKQRHEDGPVDHPVDEHELQNVTEDKHHRHDDQQGQEGQPEQASYDEEGSKAPSEAQTKAPAKVKTVAWAKVRTCPEHSRRATARTEPSAKRQASRGFNHSPVGHPVFVVVHQTHL